MSIAAMLSDSDTVEDIAYWARKKEAWLRRFLVLKNGVPSEETFLRIFRVMDPKQFKTVFRRWMAGVVGALSGTIAVDGKTVRGSGNGGERRIHMVSAFATELGVVLGQEKAASKSNEIIVIPELLDALYLKGFLVSVDAMGCQKNTARQITAKGGDKDSAIERRYYISSHDLSAEQLTAAVRAHWGIENRLHWVLDGSFGEDGSTVRKDNASQNLSRLKKIALNLIRLDTTDKTKGSLRLKRKGAAWDEDAGMNMLGLTPL